MSASPVRLTETPIPAFASAERDEDWPLLGPMIEDVGTRDVVILVDVGGGDTTARKSVL